MTQKKRYMPVNTAPKKKVMKTAYDVYHKITDEDIETILNQVKNDMVYVYLLADIQSTILTSVIEKMKKIGIYEFDAKNDINKLRDLSIKIYNDLTKNCDYNQKILFGELSDAFKPDIDNFVESLLKRIIIE